jgi:outer membrane protein OmpA-like peptidoglycan-associated protein
MKLIISSLFSLLLLQLQAQTPTIIQFGFDKSTLTDISKEKIKDFIKDNQSIELVRIEIHGHCDSSGPSNYNDILSVRRVEAVLHFLLSEGIADTNIVIKKGHGENMPLNNNSTKAKRGLNRRVELILSNKNNSAEKTLSVDQILSGTKMNSGDKIILKNINFISNTHVFLEESKPALMQLLKIMKTHPKMVIRTEGHICCTPLEETDLIDEKTGIKNLSIARAKAVQQFLIKNGIRTKRISFSGFGPSRPIYPYPENSEEERQANRRVELIIISL